MIDERTDPQAAPPDATATRFVESRAAAAPHVGPEDAPPHNDARTDPRALLRHIDAALNDIRANLDALARDRERRDLTAGRLTGAVAQSLVIALLAWAASDWIFGVAFETLATKLGFALVLQLLALTGFLLSRD